MATWRDIEAVHNTHPDWGCAEIARALGLKGGYTGWVRATFQRRGWANPKSHDPALRAAARAEAARRKTKLEEQFRQRSEFKMQTAPSIADEPPPIGIPISRHIEDDKRSRRAQRYSDFTRGFD